MHLLSTLRTSRYRDARKTCSWPVCSTLARPDLHRQADTSFPNAPCNVLLANGRTSSSTPSATFHCRSKAARRVASSSETRSYVCSTSAVASRLGGTLGRPLLLQ